MTAVKEFIARKREPAVEFVAIAAFIGMVCVFVVLPTLIKKTKSED